MPQRDLALTTGLPAGCGTDLPGGEAAGPWGLYLQLVLLAPVVVWSHCGGMCGPLVLGLRTASDASGAGPLTRLGCYQAGKGLVYVAAGAGAGWLGALAGPQLQEALGAAMPGAALFVAGALLAWAVLEVFPRLPRLGSLSFPFARAADAARELARRAPRRGTFCCGAVMAFLPCPIPLWVLSLAAITASPWHGAGLMALLVLVTTPALAPFALAPSFLPRPRGPWAARLRGAALGFAGTWLLLIGLAAHGVLPHAHLPLGDLAVRLW